MRQLNTFRNQPMKTPDLQLLDGAVSEEILDAMRKASAELTRIGVRHALVGGLAVGAHGWPRATRDVDFLVGPEGFERHGAIVTFRDGMPLRVGRVTVDPILRADDEAYLDAALRLPAPGEPPPIAPIEALVYMKLRSPRRKDEVDVLELMKVDIGAVNEDRIVAYLEEHAPDLVERFNHICDKADEEFGL